MTHALTEWLLSNSTIQSLVGLNSTGDTHKIYPVIIAQDEKPPFVCIRIAGVSPVVCKGEASLKENDTVEVNCYGNSYLETYTLYRAIRDVIDAGTFTAMDGTELVGEFRDSRDATAGEMQQLAIRNIWGILSTYNLDVKLGSIT